MAPAFILIGSIAGFATALFSFFLFDANLLTALAIWVGSGPLSALLALAAPRPTAQGQGLPEAA